jgi:5-formyltetrahydrofolate cyclo-ligase
VARFQESKIISADKQLNKKKMSSLELTKKKIRSKILLRLKTQKEADRKRHSNAIKIKLLRNGAFIKAKTVMFYIAFGGEVETTEMIETARKLGKMIAVPVCMANTDLMRPCILDYNAGLVRGPYGVLEPAVKRYLSLKELDLVVVPAVAFDKKGNRLGRGKGCYDIFLRKIPKDTPSIGMAFGFQIVSSLPTAPHDVGVQKVLWS